MFFFEKALVHVVFLRYLVLSQSPCIFQKRTEDNTSKSPWQATKAMWEMLW